MKIHYPGTTGGYKMDSDDVNYVRQEYLWPHIWEIKREIERIRNNN
jgi:aminopeptidase-like protein